MRPTESNNPPPARPLSDPLGPQERLTRRAFEFDFFQAVWLFERFWGDEVLVGGLGPAAREGLRFRPGTSVSFPATDVRRIVPCRRTERDDLYHLMEVTFLGLYGVSTPLPLHYAIALLRSADVGVPDVAGGPVAGPDAGRTDLGNPVRDFLDIFHHRVISLFYLAWLKYRYERTYVAPQRDVLTEYLRLLYGCPPGVKEEELGVSPVRLLRYIGALTQHPRSAGTLGGLLSDYWSGLPVRVQQFVGQWVALEEGDQNRFGRLNCTLGVDLTIGEQLYDLCGTFTISVGPVDWATYVAFVPGSVLFQQTCAIARLYCCDPLAFKIEVRLRAGEVPAMELTAGPGAGALGWTSWVRTADLGETAVTFDGPRDFQRAA